MRVPVPCMDETSRAIVYDDMASDCFFLEMRKSFKVQNFVLDLLDVTIVFMLL